MVEKKRYSSTRVKEETNKNYDELFPAPEYSTRTDRLDHGAKLFKTIKEKVDPCLVIEGNWEKKALYMLDKYKTLIIENPRLVTEPANDEDWFPCKLRIPTYDLKGEFLGFICRNKRCPIDLSAQYIIKGSRHLKLITKEDCWLCGEMIESKRIGLKEEPSKLELIESHKEGIPLTEFQTQAQLFNRIREETGLRLNDYDMRLILKNVKLADGEREYDKGVTAIAEKLDISRVTINKFLHCYKKLEPDLTTYSRYH